VLIVVSTLDGVDVAEDKTCGAAFCVAALGLANAVRREIAGLHSIARAPGQLGRSARLCSVGPGAFGAVQIRPVASATLAVDRFDHDRLDR